MSERSDSNRSTAPSSGYSHLSLDCVIATTVPAKLCILASVWNCLQPSSRRSLLQLAGSFNEDLQQDLQSLAVVAGFQPLPLRLA